MSQAVPHPGEILREEFLVPLGMTDEHFAKSIEVAPEEAARLLAGRARLTEHLAVRVALLFGTSVQMWRNIQERWDREHKRRVV